MKTKKILIITLALLAILAAGWFVYRKITTPKATAFETQGNVDIRQVNLAFRVGGRVREVRFEEGDTVRPGDVVAVLDEGPYLDQVSFARAQLAQAEANLAKLSNGARAEEIAQARAQAAQAKANVANADIGFVRQQELLRTRVASKQEFDNAQASRDATRAQLDAAQANVQLLEAGTRWEDIAAAKAEVERNRANLQSAERSLADCQLLAPSEGVIITRAVEPGAMVAAGTTACALSLFSPVWIRTYIGERDLGRVYPGMSAQVVTDTPEGKTYPAHVGFISPVAEFTPKSVETRELRTDLVFRLRVIVDQPDKFLRQGMPVTVKLSSDENAAAPRRDDNRRQPKL